MDFRDTPDEAAFRADVRSFIAEAAPKGQGGRSADPFAQEGNREFMKKLAERKWIAPAWPVEYGGAGMSVMEQFIFNTELAEARAPRPFGIAVGFAGPTLIVHGTEEQKKKYLPEILAGDTVWCQGYSEPGAGSDLASLQTRAVRDGDDFIVNGQKIWTSGAHVSKWMILLARTDPDAPKHRGITYFIVDMKSPGVQVRPLINAADSHEFNEVFFEDVRVPARTSSVRRIVAGTWRRPPLASSDRVSAQRSGAPDGRGPGDVRAREQGQGPQHARPQRRHAHGTDGPLRGGERGHPHELQDRVHAGKRGARRPRGERREAVWHRAEPAHLPHRHEARRDVRAGGREVSGAGGADEGPHQVHVPAFRREHDRGRDERDPAQHHRDARPGALRA
jgi:hypothetical protein